MNEAQLPAFSLDVQALDLGADVNAVGLQLLETESREPVRGKDAAELWAAVFPALAAGVDYVLDFFNHVDRVRKFCSDHGILFREAATRCLVVPKPNNAQLKQLAERFETETFGLRTGEAARGADAALEGDLSSRGLDAYQGAYRRYDFCAVCELEDGWITLLSAKLWPTEIIRRVRPVVQQLDVHIARPQ